MLDLCCIIMLYLLFFLDTLGMKIAFWFDVIVIICVVKLSITFIKKILDFPNQAVSMPKLLNGYMSIIIYVGAPMVCLMFTAVAGLKVKICFAIWMAAALLFCFLIKRQSIRHLALILSSITYGYILAKWYLLYPLDGKFGNHSIKESFAILLSAVVLTIPICMIRFRKERNA